VKELLSKDLAEIISIIKNIDPERIYLFGSYAMGTFDKESDLDILVIAPSDKTPLERRSMLRKMLIEYDRKIGLDLIVYTPEEFNTLIKEPSSFLSSAIEKAIKVYEREPA